MSAEPGPSGRRGAFLKLGALVLLLAGVFAILRWTPAGAYLTRTGVLEGIEALRGSTWAPLVFVTTYAAATALAVPGTVLTLAGGALFGVVHGSLYNWIAANVGANAAFGIARGLGREAVERTTVGRLEALDRTTREHGFRGLLILRLVPLVPFNALNFGAGLTAIRWPTYAVATAVGILPGTVVYTMFADALLAGSTEASREAFVRILVSGGLLLVLAFLPPLLRKMNVKLPGSAGLVLPVLLVVTLQATGCGDGGTGDRDADAPSAEPIESAVDTSGPSEGDAMEAAEPPEPGGADALPSALPDPAPYSALLEDVVRGDRIDYRLLVERQDELRSWLDSLARVDRAALERAGRPHRIAFWTNAYNACMLDLVADHYPIRPTRSIVQRIRNSLADRPDTSVWQIDDVFEREHCEVAGEMRSQDEIEHEILRPMGEPRIHFAVNCAARSCPPLASEAYRGAELDRQLDAQVRRFLRDPDHFALRGGPEPTLRLNRVLDWFRDDFGGLDGLREFLAPYLKEEAATLVTDPDTEIDFFDYDWTLNDVER